MALPRLFPIHPLQRQSSEQPQSNNLDRLATTCYRPHSKPKNQLDSASSHIWQGLVLSNAKNSWGLIPPKDAIQYLSRVQFEANISRINSENSTKYNKSTNADISPNNNPKINSMSPQPNQDSKQSLLWKSVNQILENNSYESIVKNSASYDPFQDYSDEEEEIDDQSVSDSSIFSGFYISNRTNDDKNIRLSNEIQNTFYNEINPQCIVELCTLCIKDNAKVKLYVPKLCNLIFEAVEKQGNMLNSQDDFEGEMPPQMQQTVYLSSSFPTFECCVVISLSGHSNLYLDHFANQKPFSISVVWVFGLLCCLKKGQLVPKSFKRFPPELSKFLLCVQSQILSNWM